MPPNQNPAGAQPAGAEKTSLNHDLPGDRFSVLTVSLYILTTQVIPKFAAIFESVQMSLPLPTQILMSVSGTAAGHPLLTMGLAGAFIYCVVEFPSDFQAASINFTGFLYDSRSSESFSAR